MNDSKKYKIFKSMNGHWAVRHPDGKVSHDYLTWDDATVIIRMQLAYQQGIKPIPDTCWDAIPRSEEQKQMWTGQ